MRYEKGKIDLSTLFCDYDKIYQPKPKGDDADLGEIEYFLARGADPDASVYFPSFGIRARGSVKWDFGSSLFMEAIAGGGRKLCELLISYGAAPNIPDLHGTTPLAVAIYNQNYYMIERLLDFEQDFNAISVFEGPYRDEKGTPLSMAAHRRFYKVVNLLLKRGADPNFPVLGKKITDEIHDEKMIKLLNKYSKNKQSEDERSEDGQSEDDEHEQSEDEDVAFDYEVEDIVWDPWYYNGP